MSAQVLQFKPKPKAVWQRRITLGGRDVTLVREADAAKILGVSEVQLMNLTPPALIVAKEIYYDRSDVEAQRDVASAPAAS